MALSGVHIAWSYCTTGAVPGSNQVNKNPATLPYKTVSSETMASAATSTSSAPAPSSDGRPLLSIASSAAIFYAVGASPNASASPRRYFDPTNGPIDIYVDSGDKFAWIAA
ncbi:hypothetical protein [Bradyrhizobium sp. Cp5.3]|uniref:hypothetical protein n=1 Tax=Bradyrhizobium sp. Cp5.3 TaxID=443598 RepID=UPI0012EC973D|nr:hypothetical protein [Bradyrhizobium sp. Cp5.3]